ncbi:MAG: glycerophosphodiester phosphodiesterase family protein [Pseudomonadota bacterium]
MIEKFVAHRGYQKEYPENSLLAFQKAIEVGAQYIELDIQLTADKVPVVFHDPTLDRMTDESGAIHERTWASLQDVSVHEPSRFGETFKPNLMTPLSDMSGFLKTNPQVTCYLEVKSHNMDHFSHEEVLAAIGDALGSQLTQCYLISFDTDIIRTAHQLGWSRLGWVLTTWNQIDQALTHAPYLEVVFCDKGVVFEQGDVSHYPWNWVVYEVDQEQDVVALMKQGVQQIETFAIKDMLMCFSGDENAIDKG